MILDRYLTAGAERIRFAVALLVVGLVCFSLGQPTPSWNMAEARDERAAGEFDTLQAKRVEILNQNGIAVITLTATESGRGKLSIASQDGRRELIVLEQDGTVAQGGSLQIYAGGQQPNSPALVNLGVNTTLTDKGLPLGGEMFLNNAAGELVLNVTTQSDGAGLLGIWGSGGEGRVLYPYD